MTDFPPRPLYLEELRSYVPGFPDAVHTRAPGFRGGPFYAYVRAYLSDSDSLIVRLDLPAEDFPELRKDVEADGLSWEDAEFEAYVPRAEAECAGFPSPAGGTPEDPRPAIRRAEDVRAAREERVAREGRVAVLMEEMRAGTRPRPLPELRTPPVRPFWLDAYRVRPASPETEAERGDREAAEFAAWGSGRP